LSHDTITKRTAHLNNHTIHNLVHNRWLHCTLRSTEYLYQLHWFDGRWIPKTSTVNCSITCQICILATLK